MKIIDSADIDSDNRKRPLNNTARVEIQIYLDVPSSELAKMSDPGKPLVAGDVARAKLAEASSVGDLLRRIERWTEGAVVRVSGR